MPDSELRDCFLDSRQCKLKARLSFAWLGNPASLTRSECGLFDWFERMIPLSLNFSTLRARLWALSGSLRLVLVVVLAAKRFCGLVHSLLLWAKATRKL